MARVNDLPHVFRAIGVMGFFKRVYQQINEDNVFTWAAALAYSWLFAIFPFFVFMLSLVPFIPETKQVELREDVAGLIDESLPPDSASIIKKQIDNVLQKPGAGGFLSFGLVLTIWAASGGMSMTMYALDKAYDVEKTRAYWRQRLMAIALTMVSALCIVLVLLLLPIGTGVLAWLARQGELLGWVRFLIDFVRYGVAIALLLGLVGLIYYLGPSLRTKFHVITPGAVFTIVVWVALGYVFNLYITQWGGAASYNKTYGAVAGMVILLALFYVDAAVLLIGAEINSEIDFVTLGLRSTPEERPEEAAARAAPVDEEKEALARELQAKRRGDLAGGGLTAPPRAEAVSMSRASRGWLIALSTLGLVLVLDKFRQRRAASRAKRFARSERLKQVYPATFSALRPAEPPAGKDQPRV